MSHRFRVSLQRVVCQNEQLNEWGKDEMRLIGFGVTRRGVVFATGFRSLGSYGTGDVREGAALGGPLIETELPDDGLEVLLFLWLVEEDGGGVGRAAASIEAQMRERFRASAALLTETAFPRECISFAAFYKAAIPMSAVIEQAGTDGRNDHVYLPADVVIGRPAAGGVLDNGVRTGEASFSRSKHLGHYDVFLRFRYERVPVILG